MTCGKSCQPSPASRDAFEIVDFDHATRISMRRSLLQTARPARSAIRSSRSYGTECRPESFRIATVVSSCCRTPVAGCAEVWHTRRTGGDQEQFKWHVHLSCSRAKQPAMSSVCFVCVGPAISNRLGRRACSAAHGACSLSSRRASAKILGDYWNGGKIVWRVAVVGVEPEMPVTGVEAGTVGRAMASSR